MREVFVYGTLCSALGHDMHRVLTHGARFIGDATVRGALYDLGAYPGLVTEGDDLERVSGEAYALDAAHAEATLALLDAYEGCANSDPEPHEYRRAIVQVRFNDGSQRDAWTYVLSRSHAGLKRIPGGDYVAWRRRRG